MATDAMEAMTPAIALKMEIHKVMQAKVKKVGLPVPKLPPTREYRGDSDGHMDTVYEMKDQALIKKKSGVRKGAHVWTDEERSQLIRERAAGRSWDDLAEEYGVSKGAVQVQARRGRAKGYGEYQLYVRNKNKRSSNQSKG